jgi:hypothetical protein
MSSSSADEELLKQLRVALREVNKKSKLFVKAEDTVDIPDDEVVLLVLSAADRRVAFLESMLNESNKSSSSTISSLANDPAAVLRKSGITNDDSDDDDDKKRHVVSIKSSNGSHTNAAARPAVQRSTSAVALPRVRGATVTSSSTATTAATGSVVSATPRLEIVGAGLSTAVVGRVASFVVRFVAADGKLKHVAGKAPTAVFHAPDGVDVAANVTKCRDGSFALSYAVPVSANADAIASLDVFINGQRSKLSPYAVQLSRRAT